MTDSRAMRNAFFMLCVGFLAYCAFALLKPRVVEFRDSQALFARVVELRGIAHRAIVAEMNSDALRPGAQETGGGRGPVLCADFPDAMIVSRPAQPHGGQSGDETWWRITLWCRAVDGPH